MNGTIGAGVGGYEFCLCNDDGSPFAPPVGSSYFLSAYGYPPNSINAATEPCFAVGIAGGIAWSPCITLLTINMLAFDVAPWCFGLEALPDDISSVDGHMVYAAGDDPGNLVTMYPCTIAQLEDCLVACLNDDSCPPPTASENETWGGVKTLYR
jgi:hypothetical protein